MEDDAEALSFVTTTTEVCITRILWIGAHTAPVVFRITLIYGQLVFDVQVDFRCNIKKLRRHLESSTHVVQYYSSGSKRSHDVVQVQSHVPGVILWWNKYL